MAPVKRWPLELFLKIVRQYCTYSFGSRLSLRKRASKRCQADKPEESDLAAGALSGPSCLPLRGSLKFEVKGPGCIRYGRYLHWLDDTGCKV